MNLIKLFLVSETLSDDDPILVAREKRKKMRDNSFKAWVKRHNLNLMATLFFLILVAILFGSDVIEMIVGAK